MRRSAVGVGIAGVAALIVVLPVVLHGFDALRSGGPETHPGFDGEVYVLSAVGSIDDRMAPDLGSRVDAVIERLGTARVALDADPAPTRERGTSPRTAAGDGTEVAARLEDRLAATGRTGSWRPASASDLDRFAPPFVAPVVTRDGSSLVLVLRLHSGFVFGFEPTRGDVLYPLKEFELAWTGMVRTFDPPLEFDAFWR